jgi:hypothetical protein
MGVMVTSALYLNRGHGYSFVCSVGNSRSNSAGLLVYDGMRTYPGHQCCIIGPSGHCQTCREEVNILCRPCGIELCHDSCYKHVIYLYCIHDHVMK